MNGGDMLRLTLYVRPRTKKNSQQIVRVKDRFGREHMKIIPSAAYKTFEKDCLKQITGYHRWHIDRPVNVKCVFYMHTQRAVDLNNLLEAATDMLVKAGVLADDNSRIVASHDGSRVRYDKKLPRVEITITPSEDDYQLQFKAERDRQTQKR